MNMDKASDRPMPKRAFITGEDGFTGRYVSAALVQQGYTITHEKDLSGGPLDITSLESCRRVLRQAQPDYIVHLAALSFVAHEDSAELYRVNTVGATNLLQAVEDERLSLKKIILASSANIYGNSDQLPITEQHIAAPTNHYASSKLAMEYMARTWFDKYPIVITRPFNYTGVGQAGHFLIPKIVRYFVERSPLIKLGNFNVARDFSDVRVIAAMYAFLLANGKAGETYNLCSGKAYSLNEIIQFMEKIANYHINVEIDPALVRANEIQTLYGSPSLIAQTIDASFMQKYSFKDTLQWMYEDGLTSE